MAGAGSNLDQNAPKFFSVAHLNIYNQKQGVLNEYWQNDVFWATLIYIYIYIQHHHEHVNVTKSFNRIVKESFPPGTLLHKLFNKNNLKLSYSTTMNMSAVISKHNKKILRGGMEEELRNCNCQGGLASCPVEGRCREKGVMYKAVISAQGEEDKQYIGATATEFKKRWANHKKSMRLEKYRHETTLSSIAGR